MASELVTNAYLHSSGAYSLRLRDAGPSRVRLSVWDTDPHVPAPFHRSAEAPAELADRGRGLYLVTLYAESWGAYPMRGGLPGQGGKLLWVECAATEEKEKKEKKEEDGTGAVPGDRRTGRA
ncbi:ATP-binding protein [Streptomyces sp. NPDC088251]|uniref:ATP-binding protein n=1 Tax=unclassified Streptomyces TaxID=2593676 RepID=UPI003801055B